MQWGFFCSHAPCWGAWGAAFGHRSSVPLEQPVWQSMCLESWATRDTILNLARCLLFAGFSWMLQMWAREGQQICVCGTLPSLLSSSLWLHALVHALVVTCGPCMTKSAGMWSWGCWLGGTCPSTCAVGCTQHCSPGGCVLALRWVQMTREGCGVWSPRASEELKWPDLTGPQVLLLES